MRIDQQRVKEALRIAATALVGGFVIAYGFSLLAPTKAKANPGCSVGAGAAHVSGHVDTGSPINIGAEGQKMLIEMACDSAIAKDWLAGIGINYGFFSGDLDKLGAQNDLTVFGRVGPKVGGAWVYGHAGHTWIDTSGGQLDGWKYGLGVETRLLLDSPVYFDLRYSRVDLNDVFGSGMDIQADEMMALFKWKFEPKKLPVIAPWLENEDNSKASDPKMPAASPKKR